MAPVGGIAHIRRNGPPGQGTKQKQSIHNLQMLQEWQNPHRPAKTAGNRPYRTQRRHRRIRRHRRRRSPPRPARDILIGSFRPAHTPNSFDVTANSLQSILPSSTAPPNFQRPPPRRTGAVPLFDASPSKARPSSTFFDANRHSGQHRQRLPLATSARPAPPSISAFCRVQVHIQPLIDLFDAVDTVPLSVRPEKVPRAVVLQCPWFST